jgi:prevent-host-death family protein
MLDTNTDIDPIRRRASDLEGLRLVLAPTAGDRYRVKVADDGSTVGPASTLFLWLMSRPAGTPGTEGASHVCYACRMTEVASRQLRNRTRALLERVAAGEDITVTIDGRPVARLVPPEPRERWVPREAFVARILGHQADPGLTPHLTALAPDTTDDLTL